MADRDEIIRGLLVAPARHLDLLARMPRRFKRRGWALDDRLHIATAAVACVAIGLKDQVFRVPPGADDPPEWLAVVGRSAAQRIVEALELEDMLRPFEPTSLAR